MSFWQTVWAVVMGIAADRWASLLITIVLDWIHK